MRSCGKSDSSFRKRIVFGGREALSVREPFEIASAEISSHVAQTGSTQGPAQ